MSAPLKLKSWFRSRSRGSRSAEVDERSSICRPRVRTQGLEENLQAFTHTCVGARIERWPPVDGIFRRRMVVVDRRALPRWRISFVQEAVAAILTSIYEAEFLEFSYGFQPERGQHDAWMRSRMGWGSGRSTGSSTRISSRSFDIDQPHMAETVH